jgi:hypothetical protein
LSGSTGELHGLRERRESRGWLSNVAGRAFLLLVALSGAAAALLRGDEWLDRSSPFGALVRIATLAAAVIALTYIATTQSRRIMGRVASEVALAAVALVLADFLVATWEPLNADAQSVRIRGAQRHGVPFDGRAVSEVVRDLQREGVDALPGISRNWPRLPMVRERLPDDFYPLSHASGATVVECNEGGDYLVWVADEYGFNNPPGLIDRGQLQIAIVGESLALGYCLASEFSFGGRLRSSYPRTANLALAGTRTLTQLASFREYVEPLEPTIVLWSVNPSFVESVEERADPRLSRYLDPGFSQGLAGRQGEVDTIIREIGLATQVALDAAATERRAAATPAERLRSALRLSEVRGRLLPAVRAQFGTLVQSGRSDRRVADGDSRLAAFLESLAIARAATESWGGQLIVFITPTYREVVAGQIATPFRHGDLSGAVSALGIPVVDVVARFAAHPDPASLFVMGGNNHLTSAGNAMLVEEVTAEIRRQWQLRDRQAREDGA